MVFAIHLGKGLMLRSKLQRWSHSSRFESILKPGSKMKVVNGDDCMNMYYNCMPEKSSSCRCDHDQQAHLLVDQNYNIGSGIVPEDEYQRHWQRQVYLHSYRFTRRRSVAQRLRVPIRKLRMAWVLMRGFCTSQAKLAGSKLSNYVKFHKSSAHLLSKLHACCHFHPHVAL